MRRLGLGFWGVVALCLGGSLTSVAWLAAASLGSTTVTPAGEPASGASQSLLSLVVPGVQVLDGGQQLRDQRLVQRTDPQVMAIRALSRTEFAHLGGGQAARLARADFPAIVDRANSATPPLPPGDRIVRYISAHAAQITLPGNRHGVIESAGPIARQISSSHFAPLNLSLTDTGKSFTPVSSAVGVHIPSRLRDGVALGDNGVSLTPVDANHRPVGGSGATIDGSSVLYANTLPDTDTLVKPTTTGFETYALLRSSRSPSKLRFRVGMPAGGRLESTGGGEARVVVGGRTVATVLAPTAKDATGEQVPVSTRTSGKYLVVALGLGPAGAYQYPIAVDPTVIDKAIHLSNEEQGNWEFYNAEGPKFNYGLVLPGGELGHSYFAYIPGTGETLAGENSFFSYRTQGESHIYGYTIKSYVDPLSPTAVKTQAYIGKYNTVEKRAEIENSGHEQYAIPSGASEHRLCVEASCATGTVTTADKNNSAFFTQFALEKGHFETYKATLELGTAIEILQEKGPSVSVPNGLEWEEGGRTWQNVGGAGGVEGFFVSTAPTSEWVLAINASDPGTGIYKEGYSSPNKVGWGVTPKTYSQNGCVGVQCDESLLTGAMHLSEAGGELPEGEDTIEAKVEDAAGLSASITPIKVRVDNTVPYIGSGILGLPTSHELSQGRYKLTAAAIDGSGTHKPSAGVNKLNLYLDGQEVPIETETECEHGSTECQSTGKWTLNLQEEVPGKHVLLFKARDWAGNTATQEVPITIRQAAPVSFGPGAVNPQTGEYTLSSSDASLTVPAGLPLTVSRTYRSEHLTAGSVSPFGPQWTLSLSGEESLVKLANGNVTLTNATGKQTTFVRKGLTEFTSPDGDSNLTLTEVLEGIKTKEFILKTTSGSVTKFKLPANEGTVWVPAIQEGPASTGSTTFSFQKVSGVIEPTEELAGAPTGVSCSPTLTAGCRALTFKYATSTTATGEAPSEWGNYSGRLEQVIFHAYNNSTGKMEEKAVAQYSYDKQGRLRAEWNPQISPALKVKYGYDAENHVTAMSLPGQEPWAFGYGTVENDTRARLLTVTRSNPSTELTESAAPTNTEAPKFTVAKLLVGISDSVTTGTWSNGPIIRYTYQWERCNSTGGFCKAMLGAVNQSYTPRPADGEHKLVVQVTATNADGSTTVTTAASELVPPVPGYLSSFGSLGTETGKFKTPTYVANYGGNVYVSDTANNRVEEYETATAKFKVIGSLGTGNGQFKEPKGIAFNESNGEMFVVDSGNSRIESFTSAGVYKSQGATASGARGIVSAGGGLFYVSNATTNEIEEFIGVTKFSAFGSTGTGNGQFKSPTGLAYVGSRLYVVDTGNNRVQKFNGTTYVSQFGSAGTGTGQFKEPLGISSSLVVVDSGNNRLEGFEENGNCMWQVGSSGTGNGQFKAPTGDVSEGENLWVVDSGNNRVEKFGKVTQAETPLAPGLPPSVGTQSAWTVDYNVPLSGTGAPQKMNQAEVEKWGQKDLPTEATALFPPDEPMGWPAGDYKRAAIYYLDSAARVVNFASPNGGISTAEYNKYNDVERSLTPGNRAIALKEGAKSAEVSKLLDTESTFAEEGTEVTEVLGPQHTIKMAGGSEVLARKKTHYYYDEGAPTEGRPYRLVTKRTEAALVAAKEEEVRTTTTSYSGQENLGWKLHKPTSVTADPSGLKLTHTAVYDATTGNVIETTQPAVGSTAMQTIYYSTASNSKYPACGLHPEWANLPCQTQPTKQPENGLPALPIKKFTKYNMWDSIESSTDTVGSVSRTSTTTYDGAGRLSTSQVTSSVNTALPTVKYRYDETSGGLDELSTTTEAKTQSLVSVYNKWGQMTSYTDADGNKSTFEYETEKDERLTKVSDGKGTQTYVYDETTGAARELVDSAAGKFTAGYDIEGNMTTIGYPNGMTATYTYNQVNNPIGLEYVKTTNCSSKCTWFSDSVARSIYDQWISQTSSQSSQAYSYDALGRLLQVQDTPVGGGCTTRLYEYDADTNRTKLTTRAPGAEGKCATEGGTVEAHTYDPADRLLDTGTSYDTFGDTTKVPAADAGGTELTSSFYVDDQLASESQHEETIGFNLDPARRTRETVSTGKVVATEIDHYVGENREPAWSGEISGKWTRNIAGIDGSLVAVQQNGENPVLQLINLHGDVIATASTSETATELTRSTDTTEFGVPRVSEAPKYGWLGAHQVPTELPSGVIAMGARSYVPQLGRFLQVDPVSGGSANAYTYTFGDPVNSSDPGGAYTMSHEDWESELAGGIASTAAAARTLEIEGEEAARVAAEEAAAREEAEIAARQAEWDAWWAGYFSSLSSEGFVSAEELQELEAWEAEAEGAAYHESGPEGDSLNLESGLLYEPIEGNEKAIGNAIVKEKLATLCEKEYSARGTVSQHGACMRYVNIFKEALGTIKEGWSVVKATGKGLLHKAIRAVKWVLTARCHAQGPGYTQGACENTFRGKDGIADKCEVEGIGLFLSGFVPETAALKWLVTGAGAKNLASC
jgi:RHS repeat-associated protein